MSSRAPTLLVIEDTEDEALLVSAAARKAHPGLSVHVVTDGLEGISYLAGIAPFEDRGRYPLPQLVILDLFMPEVDGFEVLTWRRERSELVDVPTIVLTASIDPRDEERALALGATSVLRKPTDLVQLAHIVSKTVHQYIGSGEMIGAHIWAAG
jgi:CheY-like chemotaxis protein